jgi:haloalkane dehalogenase
MQSNSKLPRRKVLGSHIAYREAGSPGGPVAVFLHGNPTSSYIWRNIIGRVAAVAHCIAPDLIGFGQSGKPDIAYRFTDHVRYLEAFIDASGITSAYLVAQDWGTALAFELAARRPDFVRGLAFMEFIRPMAGWDDFHQVPAAREMFRKFRTSGVGEKLILEENVFVERVLPGSIKRQLTDEEMMAYRAPFPTPKSRLPVWRLPNELPIAGEPSDTSALIENAHAVLRASDYPKVLFAGDPGALVSPAFARTFARKLKNCRVVQLGAGAHYLQEDHPEAIANGVCELIAENDGARAGTPNAPGARVTITYCAPCGYEKRARDAAARLARELSINPVLVAGKGGVFRVSVGDQVLVSRGKGYFPDSGEIVEAVRSALAPSSGPPQASR